MVFIENSGGWLLKKDGGFAFFELTTLLLLLCVFFAGVIFLTRDMGSQRGISGKDPLLQEGEKLLDDLEAIFSRATAVIDGPDGITICGDLDGDEKTGCKSCSSGGTCECGFVCGGCQGRERADIHTADGSGKLVVEVCANEGKPLEAVLTDCLDSEAKNPLIIKYSRKETGQPGCYETDRITLFVNLKKDGDSKIFKRSFTLEKPLTLIAR